MAVKRSIEMIRKAKRKKNSRAFWSKSQESLYKECVALLEQAGFLVRREELKRGHCWRVMSGSCRSLTHRYVFVDSRLSANEQIAFLSAKLNELNVSRPLVEQSELQLESAA
jgi:hypothetical protein